MQKTVQQQTSPTSGNRFKQLFQKYGKVAIGVHLIVYTSFFAGCYIALDQKVDVKGALSKVGLLSTKTYEETADENRQPGWFDKFLSGGSSTVALAFLCNKALFPIRTPITLALTPVVAKFLRSRNIIKNV